MTLYSITHRNSECSRKVSRKNISKFAVLTSHSWFDSSTTENVYFDFTNYLSEKIDISQIFCILWRIKVSSRSFDAEETCTAGQSMCKGAKAFNCAKYIGILIYSNLFILHRSIKTLWNAWVITITTRTCVNCISTITTIVWNSG